MAAVTPKTVATSAWGAVRLFVEHVFVEPIKGGRLRDVGWPAGLRPIVVVALVGYLVAVLLVVSAPLIRQELELTAQSGAYIPPMPRAVIWITLALTVLAVSLGQAGALHASPWVRWSVTVFTVLVLLLPTVVDASGLSRGYAIVSSIGLVLLVALRGHRRFAWWEFVVIAALLFSTFALAITVISAASLPFGYDFVPMVVALVIMTIGTLAIPAAMTAGASLAELAVSSAVWAAGVVRDRFGRVAVIVLLWAVVLWRLVDLGLQTGGIVADPGTEGRRILSAFLFLAAIAGSWMLLRRIRGDKAPDITTSELITTLASISLLIAAVLTLIVPVTLLQSLGLIIRAFGGPASLDAAIAGFTTLSTSSVAIGITRMVVGAALIVLGFVLARRGRAVLPELLVAIGLSNGVMGATNASGTALAWTPESLALVATLASFGLLIWMIATRSATISRLVAVVGALVIAAVFANRGILSDPLAFVLGSSAIAAVLLGFVWSFLTGYSAANGDSPRYPRPARVLLVLGNTLFAATVLAYTYLARDPDSAVNLPDFTELGAQGFGDALIACALMTAFLAALRDRRLA